MEQQMRFAHVNLVARDWRALARFYVDVFACTPTGEERDLSGSWIEKAVGIDGARIRGVHLALPGTGHNGPTLEIFEYEPAGTADSPTANRPGFGHIAFAVEDVDAVRRCVLDAGGSALGEVVAQTIPGTGTITFAYTRDPEGNIVEIQRWEVS